MRTDKTTLKHYRKFRASGNTPVQAVRSARTLTKWEALEYRGKVRIQADHENENYFDVYGEPDTEQQRKDIVDAIEQHGLTYVFTEYFSNGEWHQADAIGMCIYERPTDPFCNDYAPDLMKSAVDQYEEAKERSRAKKKVKKLRKELRAAEDALKALA